MPRFRWIALQGGSRGVLAPLLLLFLITTSGTPAFAADVSAACTSPVARVVSIQGSVDLLRAGQADWSKVTRLDTPLCEGDKLRTGALSRAALFIQPETLLRVDQNTSIAVSQTAEETLVEFTQEDVLPAAAGAYSCGAGYFITRFPRKFRVKTPHLNAAVEGTEFLVAMRCESTELSVFEGKVLAAGAGANIFPAQSISSGQILTIGGAEPPAVKLLVKPADAVQWVLYYPPLSDPGVTVPSADECTQLPAGAIRQICLAQRAEHFLRVGRVEQAESEIAQALAEGAPSGEALAIRAVISVVKNDKEGALSAGQKAVEVSPNSSRAWLALSYAQQASFKLEDSLSSARKAQALESNSSVTNARVAELLMSLGRIKEAEVAARAAVDANPAESRAHTVLGFVHLAQIKTKKARTDFLAAIERDSSDPLPRLGLGLAIIRTGKLSDGREQLEIAVSLDPTNSLLRSYVGKAYYEENNKERDQLATTQFDLAKQLDPKDPTPWFYDAILKQTQNRPVEALEDLQKSIELNDNRAVYRSRLLLDEDLASRSTSLAQVYRGLGFDQLALLTVYGALEGDPTNFSAHRLLSDSFLGEPQHEIARVSEALQSQLWQPLDVSPLQIQQLDDAQFILRGAGPGTPGLYEFNPLFVQQGVRFQASGIVGQNATVGDQVLLSGLYERFSASIGQFHYETDGFQEGWGLKKNIYDALFQVELTPESSILLEGRLSDRTQGDLSENFFGETQQVRNTFDRDLLRAGLRQRFTPEISVVGVVTYQEARDTTETPPGSVLFESDVDETAVELQAVYRRKRLSLLLGGGEYRGDGTIFFPGFGSNVLKSTAENAYAYVYWEAIPRMLRLEVGASAERVDDNAFSSEFDQVNPKFGVIFRPWDGTVLRAASTRVLRRTLIAEQTIEPTQVAGFNQFYDDSLGTDSRRIAAGLDQTLGKELFAGLEASKRRLVIPQSFTDPQEYFQWDERLYRGYVYWAPVPALSTTVEYSYEKITENTNFFDTFLEATTQKVPVTVSAFIPRSGLVLRATGTHVHQTGEFLQAGAFQPGSSDFWTADLAAQYLLPRRMGLLTLEASNVFNKQFQYQETDVRTPTLARERIVFARVSVAF